MISRRNFLRWSPLAALLAAPRLRGFGQNQTAPATELVPADFVDVTATSGVDFLHQAPHSSRKYLLETMGSGVALFDYDNDGRLDLFLVNGAPFGDLPLKERFRRRPIPNTGTASTIRSRTAALRM